MDSRGEDRAGGPDRRLWQMPMEEMPGACPHLTASSLHGTAFDRFLGDLHVATSPWSSVLLGLLAAPSLNCPCPRHPGPRVSSTSHFCLPTTVLRPFHSTPNVRTRWHGLPLLSRQPQPRSQIQPRPRHKRLANIFPLCSKHICPLPSGGPIWLSLGT